MEKEQRSREERLKEFVLSEIETKGPIPFSQFMEWCLYHPDYGYYRSEGTRIGREGDYYTSPCVHPLFGRLIAKQLLQMAEMLGGERFDIVEMGGGPGFLCKDILDWAETHAPPFYHRLCYHLVEVVPPDLQGQNFSRHEKGGRIHWQDPEAFKRRTLQVQGCVLSNELIDAFPVHRVILCQGRLREIYIAHCGGRLEERWGELSDPRIGRYFESMGIRLAEGQKAEVNLQALDWIENVGRCLARGFVLTIDYGHPAEELYAPHRRNGTFLCYSKHGTSENPYERLGEQDMTSHVNFTSLIRKGEEVGLTFSGLVPQYRFLIGLGLFEEMQALEERLSPLEGLRLRLSLKHLIEPEVGMGEVFKVLIQHKGVERPQLDGLRDLHSTPWPASRKAV